MLVLVGAALLSGGCSTVGNYLPNFRSLGVYKIDVNQGNFLTEDQVDRLKPGLTRQQARAILGSPLLTDVFHENRWDYVYEYRRQGVTTEQRKFTVYFQDDKLARWEGDEQPTSAVAQNRAAAEKSLDMPQDDESGIVRWFKGIFGRR
ncbi:MAG: outer membrane protein assembly factor BamE [Casimicrobiaceae bacterium]